MKAQLSLEFLAYLALAGLSMLSAMGMIYANSGRLASIIEGYEASEFTGAINNGILSGSSVYPISVFVPKGMCNASVSNSTISTSYGSFHFIGQVLIQHSVLCPDGMTKEIEVLNDQYVVKVVTG